MATPLDQLAELAGEEGEDFDESEDEGGDNGDDDAMLVSPKKNEPVVIEIGDSPANFSNTSPALPKKPEGRCNYPLCRYAHDPDVVLRACAHPGCNQAHHHFCATAAGDDGPGTSSRCFEHMMLDGVVDTDRSEPIGSQKHLIATGDDDAMSVSSPAKMLATPTRSSNSSSPPDDQSPPPKAPATPATPQPDDPQPDDPQPKEPQSARRVAAAASPRPADPSDMFGFCIGDVIKMKADNSCWFHTATHYVEKDPLASDLALWAVGDSIIDFRSRLSDICKGTIVVHGLQLAKVPIDFRIGAPPVRSDEPVETVRAPRQPKLLRTGQMPWRWSI